MKEKKENMNNNKTHFSPNRTLKRTRNRENGGWQT